MQEDLYRHGRALAHDALMTATFTESRCVWYFITCFLT